MLQQYNVGGSKSFRLLFVNRWIQATDLNQLQLLFLPPKVRVQLQNHKKKIVWYCVDYVWEKRQRILFSFSLLFTKVLESHLALNNRIFKGNLTPSLEQRQDGPSGQQISHVNSTCLQLKRHNRLSVAAIFGGWVSLHAVFVKQRPCWVCLRLQCNARLGKSRISQKMLLS